MVGNRSNKIHRETNQMFVAAGMVLSALFLFGLLFTLGYIIKSEIEYSKMNKRHQENWPDPNK